MFFKNVTRGEWDDVLHLEIAPRERDVILHADWLGVSSTATTNLSVRLPCPLSDLVEAVESDPIAQVTASSSSSSESEEEKVCMICSWNYENISYHVRFS
jgi:hypothetical protein